MNTSGVLTPLLVAVAAIGLVFPAAAIEVQPTAEQVRAAIALGKEAAQRASPPDSFYVRFGGNDDLHPQGFLITKLGSLSVLATHMALRGLEPSSSDIAQVVGAPTMLVSTMMFGDNPSFAVDSYLVIEQDDRAIKPVTVRFDAQASRSAAWPEAPRFKARVVASFKYADFDPMAKTTITVFPARGGAVSFSVDFARVK